MTERAERLRDAFEHAEIPVELSTDVRRALLEKYLLICAVGGTTAVTRETLGVVRETPRPGACLRDRRGGPPAVARAAGVTLPDDTVDRTLKLASPFRPGAVPRSPRTCCRADDSSSKLCTGMPHASASASGVPTAYRLRRLRGPPAARGGEARLTAPP